MHPLDLEIISDLIHLTLLDRIEIFTMLFDVMFIKLVTNHCQRKCCSVNWELHLFKQVRYRTNMVFVCMGNNNANDLFSNLTNVCKIRYQNIDTVHLVIRKAHSHIDQDRFFVCLDDGNISANFTQTAQRRNTDFVI